MLLTSASPLESMTLQAGQCGFWVWEDQLQPPNSAQSQRTPSQHSRSATQGISPAAAGRHRMQGSGPSPQQSGSQPHAARAMTGPAPSADRQLPSPGEQHELPWQVCRLPVQMASSQLAGQASKCCRCGRGQVTKHTLLAGEADSTCYKCQQKGHYARNCPQAPQQGLDVPPAGDRQDIRNICYRCQELGHWAKDCPESV